MPSVNERKAVVVFGAYGHTGRFVTAELCARGYTPVLSGRDQGKLDRLRAAHPGVEARSSARDSPKSLDRALEGAAAVINCAGPFLDTSTPLIEAALRAGIHYFDVTAEQSVVRAAFDRFSEPARARGVVVLPAMAFYGGLDGHGGLGGRGRDRHRRRAGWLETHGRHPRHRPAEHRSAVRAHERQV